MSLAATAFAPDQLAFLHLATLLTSFLGIAASFATCLAYLTFPSFRRTLIARPVLAIAISDLVSVGAQGLGHFGPDAGTGTLICTSQAVFQQFGELWAILVIAYVCIQLLLVTYHPVYHVQVDQVRRFDIWVLPLSLLVAIVVAVAGIWIRDPSSHGASIYGDGYLWCFIQPGSARYYWIIFGPLLVVLALVFATTVAVRVTMYRRRRARPTLFGPARPTLDGELDATTLTGTMSLYMLVFSLTWLPIAVSHLMKFPVDKSVTPQHATSNLYLRTLVMAIFLPLRGFGDGLVAFYQAWRGREEPRGERGSFMDALKRPYASITPSQFRVDEAMKSPTTPRQQRRVRISGMPRRHDALSDEYI